MEKRKSGGALQLRLVVDKKMNRVVYAECGRPMADVLFSFLTAPVGALVRRTGKDSGLGAMDSLYKSVEEMESSLFQTPACRDLLLRPMSAADFPHQRLLLQINEDQGFSYACASRKCPKFSLFPGAKCECGRDLSIRRPCTFPYPRKGTVVFLSWAVDFFLVTDNLFITPSSDALKKELCTIAGVTPSSGHLQEQIVLVDDDEVVQLMKMSLFSNTPLTDKFLPSDFPAKPIQFPMEFLEQHLIKKEILIENSRYPIMNKLKKDALSLFTRILGIEKMVITLFHNKKRVLFVQAKKNFVDLLFSFLTFPFGSIVAKFDGKSSLGCLDNLHQVVKRFISDGHFFRRTNIPPKLYTNCLLNPPIAHHHNYENHLLKIGIQPIPRYHPKACDCGPNSKVDCIECVVNFLDPEFEWKAINPKYEGRVTTEKGGGYMRWPSNFIITNALVVKPLYGNHAENHFAPGSQQKSVVIGQNEALKLLMASLVSHDPFTDVFFSS